MSDLISWLDYNVALLFNRLCVSLGDTFSSILKIITLLGNLGFIFIVISLILILFKKTRRCGCVALISMFIGMILVLILKNSFMRARPFNDINSDYYLFWVEAGMLDENGYSLPSGHTTAAMAFGLSLFLGLNKKYSWLFLFIPLVMGMSRIYFMVHYFSDVMLGFLVGGLGTLFGSIVFELLRKLNLFNKIYNLPCIR